ncbi:hypothetical protein, partial [Mesorhizobium sp.]|uniref:hypothetical protein n=1 Tax=Mesorhizobium sp. TaxID=1871066 RepID=UPI0025C13613
IQAIPVMTCSQRTAKLSQSQKIAKSIIEIVPADWATLRVGAQTERGEVHDDFQKKMENTRVVTRSRMGAARRRPQESH